MGSAACSVAAMVMTSKPRARTCQLGGRGRPQPARASRGAWARRPPRAWHCRVRAYSSSAAHRGRTIERHRLRAQRFGQAQQVDAAIAFLLRQAQQRRRLHVHHRPVRIERIGDALAGANQSARPAHPARSRPVRDRAPARSATVRRWRAKRAPPPRRDRSCAAAPARAAPAGWACGRTARSPCRPPAST